ncbi:MAG TPA: PilT/PilU family type 4a pilus ATPase [Patescibacteria group bacterium]|nr:PilT/PilU family type 4a pilus ATPase [Patescibacteria group bacterium]
MNFNVSQLLENVVNANASDLHISVGDPPYVRINTKLQPVANAPALSLEDVNYFLSQLLEEDQLSILDVNREIDFSVALGNKARFRVNAFYQKGAPAIALRLIPMKIPTLESLHLPDVLTRLCDMKQGLFLVVGPTGHGKSTTIASMIERINESRSEHIVTVEDPIEYIFTNKKSLIEQREMYIDTHSWDVALKSILRQDPNIVLIGEMRDVETMSAALHISETGHLVFATLHTNSASSTVERIINSFPENAQSQVRLQLAQSLEVIISERLLPSPEHGMVPATEIMLASDAIRNLIREGKPHMIDNVLATSVTMGMMPLERSLALLVDKGWVEEAEAIKYTLRPDELRRLLKLRKFNK